jgi:hypothetical protein
VLLGAERVPPLDLLERLEAGAAHRGTVPFKSMNAGERAIDRSIDRSIFEPGWHGNRGTRPLIVIGQ